MAGNDIALQVILDFKKLQQQVGQIDKILAGKLGGKKGTGGVANAVVGGDKGVQQVSKFTGALNNLGLAGNNVLGIFGKLIAKVAVWTLVTTSIFAVIGVIVSLVKEMKALEDAQIRLQRILPTTGEALANQTREAYAFTEQMTKLTGALKSETLDALTVAAKAGFELGDAMSIARTAILAINITEIEDVEKATRYLLATIRQFGLEAKDSLFILDQWNELAKKTGATADEIAEGVSRSGKAFSAVGGSLNQLNAIIATTIEATGESGNKIGTMMKTLSARYADLTRAQSLQQKLSKIGIEIYDKETESFNNIFLVLAKLNLKWNNLTDAMKANIGKSAAGVRQYSRFLGVVSNFDKVTKALLDTLDSQGSSLDENEKRLKSMEYSIRQVKGAFSDLALTSNGLLEIFKFLLDNGVRPLIDSFGGLVDFIKFLDKTFNITADLKALGYFSDDDNKAIQRQTQVIIEQTRALARNRNELGSLTEFWVELYKQSDTSDARKTQIERVFNNVEGIDFKKIITNFTKTSDAVAEIQSKLSSNNVELSLTSLQRVMAKTFGEGSTEVEKYINTIQKLRNNNLIEDDVATTIENINDKIKTLKDSNEKTILQTIMNVLIKDQQEYDKFIKTISDKADVANKKIVSKLVDAFTVLEEGNTVWDNILNGFEKLGDMVYDIMRESITDGIMEGLEQVELFDNIKNNVKMAVSDVFTGLSTGFDEFLQQTFRQTGYSFSPGYTGKASDASKTSMSIPDYELIDTIKKTLGTGLVGGGLGAFSAKSTGRDAVGGGALGAGLGILGEMLVPGIGGVIGGLLGGLFSSPNPKEQEVVEDQIKFAEESLRELKTVNRNLTTLVDNTVNYGLINESYYFALNSQRGLVNV